MSAESRHMMEAITLLKDEKSKNKIPGWYKWLDRFLAAVFYVLMAYVYFNFILWLTDGK